MKNNFLHRLLSSLTKRKPPESAAEVLDFEEQLSEYMWERRWHMVPVTGLRLGPEYISGLREHGKCYRRLDDGSEQFSSLPLLTGQRWEMTILPERWPEKVTL